MININIDPLVISAHDPRVEGLLHSKYPVNVFLRMLKYPDWLIMDGHTLKILPEYQYKALFTSSNNKILTESVFNDVMRGVYDAKVGKKALEQLKSYRQRYKNCADCQKKRYFSHIQIIVAAQLPQLLLSSNIYKEQKYPQLAQIPPYVPMSIPVPVKTARVGCFDCVQKHIGQAYVTAHQAMLGYPQHFLLCCGHLAQAIQECPQQAVGLRALLTLCLGVSQQKRQGFVPVQCLYNTFTAYKNKLHSSTLSKPNQQDAEYPLIIEAVSTSLQKIPQQQRDKLMQAISRLATVQKSFSLSNKQGYEERRLLWYGLMSSISDYVVQYDRRLANIIRNVRLMFSMSPELVVNTEYDIEPGLRSMLNKNVTHKQ